MVILWELCWKNGWIWPTMTNEWFFPLGRGMQNHQRPSFSTLRYLLGTYRPLSYSTASVRVCGDDYFIYFNVFKKDTHYQLFLSIVQNNGNEPIKSSESGMIFEMRLMSRPSLHELSTWYKSLLSQFFLLILDFYEYSHKSV